MAGTMEPLRLSSRAQWRKWLQRNHDKAPEVWLVFLKAHTGKRTFAYVEAVEEALCFGWIDTTVRSIDDDTFMQRFTPRSNEKNWSKINLERFARMEAEGKMTDAGRAKRPAKVNPPKKRLQAGDPVPEYIAKELEKHPKAKQFFEEMAPGYRRDYARWIMEAKREETRAKRMADAIAKLSAGIKRWM
jgi:uncharacterized protein YdeI (YjbR/CyaY-like superfamily)